MMSENCETFEVLVSTWLDDGLDRYDQRRLLDHLTRCAGCRRFYREARALEGLVALTAPDADTSPSEPPPAAVWERIEEETRAATGTSAARWLPWVVAAAAALLIGIALPFVPWPATRTAAAEAPIEILLEENRDAMTESRFMELTTELLQADRKYHFAMQDVMKAVIEASWETEGATSEGDVDETGGEDDGDRTSRMRT